MDSRTRRSRRSWRTILAALTLAAATVPLVPAPAAADHAVSFSLLWIRCQDQNESFSDEPYVKVNLVTVRQFSDVDTGETHYFLQGPRNFDPNPPWNSNYAEIQLWESDSGPDNFLGYGYVFHDAGPGEREMYFFSSQGEYILRYAVNY